MKAARPHRRLALILSGGGARGAYETGVVWYLFDELTRLRGAPPRVDILCGTSVGAINSAYLAAHLSDPALGVRRLVDVWSSMRFDDVLGFGVRQAISLPRVLLGGGNGSGIFDVSPMSSLVEREIPWQAITRTMKEGRLSALSVSTTEVATGRTVIFMQTGPHTALPTRAPPRTLIRASRIGPEHALASAAIPLLFPPVKLNGQLYVDGGVRQNTPIAPALRLGATHVLVVGTSRLVRGVAHTTPDVQAPSATFLVGKILNALLLDHLDNDLGTVNLLNNLLDSGGQAFGESFVPALNQVAATRGGHRFNRIETLVVRPTESIGAIAGEFIRKGRMRGSSLASRQLLRLLEVGVGDDADLASYLLFDGGFARRLIELGRSDAHARRAELLDFFGAAEDDAPPEGSESGGPAGSSGWTLPPPAVG
ncbi:MAG: patatin-like phospholipase family protein [Sorangiineae bacterium]|nr:patatin-like phospholipase family protein [Polyangiaceae bacterium]MEB2321857.1 patatin-like phospholipase family protein [Sorangiineae bacterium]